MYHGDISTRKSRFAILGLLSIRPMSGYDIKKTVEQSLAHFWRESYGSIYPLLRQLFAQGLVERTKEKTSRRADRFVYSITPRGREVLGQWLLLPPEEEPTLRSELLLKLFFGNLIPDPTLERFLSDFRELQHHRIDRLRATERDILSEHGQDPSALYWLLTLRRGILIAEARAEWATQSIAELEHARRPPKRPARVAKLSPLSSHRKRPTPSR